MIRQGSPRPAPTARSATAAELSDLIPRLYRLLRTALDEDPRAPSLEQLRVMHRIDEGLRNTSALAAARQMRMSAITSILDALTQRDWIRREPDSHDRRRTTVSLTPEGRRALERGHRLTARRMGEVLNDYPDAEDQLSLAVEGLVRAVNRYDERSAAQNAAG